MRTTTLLFAGLLTLVASLPAQVYDPLISPDAALLNYSGDMSITQYLATTDLRTTVQGGNSAQCGAGPYIGYPGSYPGFWIGARVSYRLKPPELPAVCGPIQVYIHAFETTWLAGSYPDHLGQGLGATALGGLPSPPAPAPGSTPSLAQYWEACSLISNVGLGVGGAYVQTEQAGICWFWDAGIPVNSGGGVF